MMNIHLGLNVQCRTSPALSYPYSIPHVSLFDPTDEGCSTYDGDRDHGCIRENEFDFLEFASATPVLGKTNPGCR